MVSIGVVLAAEVDSGAGMMKSARAMASLNEELLHWLLVQLIGWSVAAVGKMEQIKEAPEPRLITSGQHKVASPIVAASKGTGIMFRT